MTQPAPNITPGPGNSGLFAAAGPNSTQVSETPPKPTLTGEECRALAEEANAGTTDKMDPHNVAAFDYTKKRLSQMEHHRTRELAASEHVRKCKKALDAAKKVAKQAKTDYEGAEAHFSMVVNEDPFQERIFDAANPQIKPGAETIATEPEKKKRGRKAKDPLIPDDGAPLGDLSRSEKPEQTATIGELLAASGSTPDTGMGEHSDGND